MGEILLTYQQRFRAAVRLIMANSGIDSIKDAAQILGLKHLTLYKIMDESNNPTVDQCIAVCDKGGFSANWLFLNRGEVYLKDEADIKALMKEVKSIRTKLFKE